MRGLAGLACWLMRRSVCCAWRRTYAVLTNFNLDSLYHLSDTMKIEWASSFRADGTRRRPPPSTMHGWLAKMRGTLIGDETLRNKGMREMKDARNARQYNRNKKRQLQGNHSLLSFFRSPKKQPRGGQQRQPNRLVARPSQARKPSSASATSRRPPASRRPTATSRGSHQSRPSYSSRRGSAR